MACVNSDGTISPSARRFLEVLREPAPADELAKTTGFPMFRVRSALREMEESGLVSSGRPLSDDRCRGGETRSVVTRPMPATVLEVSIETSSCRAVFRAR